MKLQTYLLRQLIIAFLFAVAGLLFVALPGIAVSAVHRLPNVDAAILLRFLPIVLQTLAPYVLPLCFMLAVVAVYGRLAADKEWIAIQMAGIQPLKLLIPAAAVATVLSGATYWMVSNELPQLKKRQKRFLIDATASVIENLQPGKTSLHVGDFFLKAAYRDDDTGIFYDVYIRKPEEMEVHADLFAESVKIRIEGDYLYANLTGVEVFDPRQGGKAEAGELQLDINLAERIGREEKQYTRPRYKTSSQLRVELATAELDVEMRERYIYELHHRATMATVFFLFLGLGAPTGLLLRRGTQLGALAVAAGYGILYYLFSMRLGKQLATSSLLNPALGAWTTTAIGGIVAVFLLRKAVRR